MLVLLGDAAEYELATHSELVPWQPYNVGLPISWFINPRILYISIHIITTINHVLNISVVIIDS